jgi:Uma2 family endonuclease
MNPSTLDSVFYPESDGLPMTESDATRDYLIYAVEVLRLYFESRGNVYVSGNLFVYYEEGNNKAVISPDVFVVFGVSAGQRRSYQTWKEGGKLPSFVLEITSRTTKRQDEVEKPQLYAELGVEEYFQYDPTADYLRPQLQGRRLQDGQYQMMELQTSEAGVVYLHSQSLGLELQLQSVEGASAAAAKELRFYDPQTGMKLLSRRELERVQAVMRRELTVAQQERDAAQQELDVAQQELDTIQQERDAAQRRAEELAARLRELGVEPEQT